ncbi:MAG: quinoprotein dehydrogenase-associated SoxYZ-like carrier [Hyphomicrobium sp.]|uniref:quinoprotein dehydrogenase-associated SoxYZ-like carrier n=1 Tax=Hyphomicrobium sp. TaxID=82 RepID=UPI003568BB01
MSVLSSYNIVRLAALMLTSVTPTHAGVPDEAFKSPMWETLSERYFGQATVVFDDRVKVTVPPIVENQAQVPVTADARLIDGVKKLIVFADLNPIQLALELEPIKAKAFVAFRMKIEQATPVRAAALTEDGVWHVGGVFLNAAGGGCTAPPKANGGVSWFDTLGETQGRLWQEKDGSVRARFRISHPMDTGLGQGNTPAYYIEKVEAKEAAGTTLARLAMFEPVSQNPTLTLVVDLPRQDPGLNIDSRDNNGKIYRANLIAPWRQSRNDQPEGSLSAP